MALQATLPLDIQLYILDWLIEPHDNPDGYRTRLSKFACVCKRWQWIIERSTFHHLTLHPSDIHDFTRLARPDRRPHVQYILLEIPIRDSVEMVSHLVPIDEVNNLIFAQAVRHLWEVLSAWKSHRLTVELGIVSSFEEKMDHSRCRSWRRSYSNLPEQLPEEDLAEDSVLPDLHLEHLKCFQDPPVDAAWLDMWQWHNWRFLGVKPLDFDFRRLPGREGQEEHHLPKAEVIVRLLIRRRYFRNISPKALSEMFKAAPCIETIHIERWCYGRRKEDGNWDQDSALLGQELPPSLKQFSFYEEFSTMYHQRPRNMRLPRSNKKLLEAMVETSRHLEHLSISFAIDAQHFFSRTRQLDWKGLKTMALTSDILLSRSNAMVNELLECVAEVAKKMPKLQILEIWHCKTGEAGIFRYEKLDRSSTVTWQGTWSFDMSRLVEEAWREVFTDPVGGLYQLGTEAICLVPEEIAGVGSVSPYLKLKKHILHDASWTQV